MFKRLCILSHIHFKFFDKEQPKFEFNFKKTLGSSFILEDYIHTVFEKPFTLHMYIV